MVKSVAVRCGAPSGRLRYDVTGVSTAERFPGCYVLDRWTGESVFCPTQHCYPTERKSKAGM
jgi:hypothetical protein